MAAMDPRVLGLGVALGIGLLIGLERERSKGKGPGRKPGGIRTFALFALMGGIAGTLGGAPLAVAAVVAATAFSVAAYVRSAAVDPGLTTEAALVVTTLTGLLAARAPTLAGGVAVTVTVILAARSSLHRFVRDTLSANEVNDGLMLAAAALVILPLLPDRAVDPYGVFNPRVVWALAVLVMTINGVGYISLRALGAGMGLPLSGLAGGFVSSAATHGAMGHRVSEDATMLKPAVAGAALSTVATPVFVAMVLAVANRDLLVALWLPLLAAGLAAMAFGGLYTLEAVHESPHEVELGSPFELRDAVLFTAIVTATMMLGAALGDWLGPRGAQVGVGIAGLADCQAAAASAATLLRSNALSVGEAVLTTLIAFSGNAVVKVVVSQVTGGRRFALRVAVGQAIVVLALWAGWAIDAWLL